MGRNTDIREYAKSKGVYLYEIAESLNVSEPTITRWLRAVLSDIRRTAILYAIDRVAAQKAVQSAAAATE